MKKPTEERVPRVGGPSSDDGPGGKPGTVDPQQTFAAVRAMQPHLRSIVENAPVVVWAIDLDGIFVSSQGQGLVHLGLRDGEAVGQSVFELYRDSPTILEHIRGALTGKESVSTVPASDRVFRNWCAPLRDANGEIIGAQGVATDITGQVLAEAELAQHGRLYQQLSQANEGLSHEIKRRLASEEALRESLERFRLMVDGSKVGLWDAWIQLADPYSPRNPVYYSPRMKALLGYQEEEFENVLGSWADRLHPDDQQRVFQALDDHLFRKVPYDTEYRVTTKSGQLLWIAARGQASWDGADRPVRISGSFTDITERKLAEERLLSEQNFLRELLRAHERDRQWMAYEIHDGLVQDMTATLLHLESLESSLRTVTQQERDDLQIAIRLSRRSVAEARRVLSGLRPPILDEEGVIMAIDYLVADQALPGVFEIQFSHQHEFLRLEPLLECTIFRIVQEALTNAKRHSRSESVDVTLMQVEDRIHLTIEDHGIGFDPAFVAIGRFGLQSMRKRAALIGGCAEIRSSSGQGTQVIVELPVIPADRSE
jgi:PAS domain S-box-containing protein